MLSAVSCCTSIYIAHSPTPLFSRKQLVSSSEKHNNPCLLASSSLAFLAGFEPSKKNFWCKTFFSSLLQKHPLHSSQQAAIGRSKRWKLKSRNTQCLLSSAKSACQQPESDQLIFFREADHPGPVDLNSDICLINTIYFVWIYRSWFMLNSKATNSR